MYLIEIDTRKFDFQGISHEEYLEFFVDIEALKK